MKPAGVTHTPGHQQA